MKVLIFFSWTTPDFISRFFVFVLFLLTVLISVPAAQAYALVGDINHDFDLDVTDAVLALQVMSGIAPAEPVYIDGDINGDGRIGLAEVIHALQIVAGTRLAEFPNIEGGYTSGPVTVTSSNCVNPADNEAFTFSSGTLTISNQIGSNFSGTIVLQADVDGYSVKVTEQLTGTIAENGELSGTFENTQTINDEFVSSGNGTFTGQVSGNTISLSFSGQDTVGDTCTYTGSTTFFISFKVVDSTGGQLTFPNGVILDIPPGAVAERTEIQITDVDCNTADVILSSAIYQQYDKKCLGGFSAKPDGLIFATPVTAIFPVRSLEPGEIPIQVALDASGEGFLVAPTDLTYDGQENTITIHNLQHFSENWLVTLYQFVEDNCRTCETYGGIVDFCDAYAKDVWFDQQSGCCLLKRSERESCASGCDCCMELLMKVESSGVDASFGECEFLTADLNVSYPYCDDPTPQSFNDAGSSLECPEDMTLEVALQPTALEMYACEQKNLREEFQVTLTGKSSEGEIIGTPVTLLPFWQPADNSLVTVNVKDVITANKSGQTTLRAQISQDPTKPYAEATLDILSNISSFTLESCPIELAVNEETAVQSIVVPAPDRPPADGPAFDPNKVVWSSDESAIAIVIPDNPADSASVVGVGKGATKINADFSYACETIRASCDVTIDCRPLTMTLEPSTVDLLVDITGRESELLIARLLDENNDRVLDENDLPLDFQTAWITSDSGTADLITLVGPETVVEAIAPSNTPVTITAYYDDFCQIKQKTTQVTVGCINLVPSVTQSKLRAGDVLPVSVNARDDNNNPVDIDPAKLSWMSSNPNVATVAPATGSLSVNITASSPGKTTVTASFDEGTCGMRTASINIEVEETRILLSENNVSIPEGDVLSIGVKLSAPPVPEDQTISVSALEYGDESISVILNQTIIFNKFNWDTYKQVLIEAEEDDLDAVNGTATIIFMPNDDHYDSANLDVEEIDNDLVNFVTSPSSLTIPEDGTTVFWVKLNLEPPAPITASVSASGDISASGALFFDSTNWESYQAVTVTAGGNVECCDCAPEPLENGPVIISGSAPEGIVLSKSVSTYIIDYNYSEEDCASGNPEGEGDPGGPEPWTLINRLFIELSRGGPASPIEHWNGIIPILTTSNPEKTCEGYVQGTGILDYYAANSYLSYDHFGEGTIVRCYYHATGYALIDITGNRDECMKPAGPEYLLRIERTTTSYVSDSCEDGWSFDWTDTDPTVTKYINLDPYNGYNNLWGEEGIYNYHHYEILNKNNL